MVSWKDGYISNNLICKPTLKTTARQSGSISGVCTGQLPSCTLTATLSTMSSLIRSHAFMLTSKVSATTRVTHKINACHQSIVKIKQKPNAKELCFPFSLFDGKTI